MQHCPTESVNNGNQVRTIPELPEVTDIRVPVCVHTLRLLETCSLLCRLHHSVAYMTGFLQHSIHRGGAARNNVVVKHLIRLYAITHAAPLVLKCRAVLNNGIALFGEDRTRLQTRYWVGRRATLLLTPSVKPALVNARPRQQLLHRNLRTHMQRLKRCDYITTYFLRRM